MLYPYVAYDMLYTIKETDPAISSLVIGQIRELDPLLAYALRRYS